MAAAIAGDAETDLTLPISDDLDDNGFPASPPTAPATSSFADDFYRSGIDWSSLQAPPSHRRRPADGTTEKFCGPLVQKNLFQAWGIEKPASGMTEKVCGPPVQKNLFQAWGIQKPPREEAAQGVPVGAGASSSSPSPSVAGSGRKRRWGGLDENGASRKPVACPFYKKIPGTPFTVDAFRYGAVEGCSAYFLSHFHYDHYGGLTKKWCHGPIYCTALTARLVKMLLSIDSAYVCPLELDTEYVIDGVKVTFLEANHCPGAALIHFRLSDGKTYLHTGDFRASKSMQLHPLLQTGRISLLYLDTTYCNPKYKFPPQEDVIDFVVRTAQRYLKKQPKTLIVVGAYSIGKENVYLAISQALEVPIYTDASRRRILHSFGWPDLSKRISSCNQSSPLHVLPLASLQHENLKKYLETLDQRFLAVLAFRPTGWTFSEAAGKELDLIKPSSRGRVTIYGVPYSEHSSFSELRDFLKFLRPQKVIPTVNVGNAANRDKMQAYFREWLKGT
ncbi:DNA cross-link repair protein SNM1 [Triticum urartu]|uniref:Metallo-beta-lactamase domain-containing protein n=1 Tax=Triticum urartu TaxID=4572 RepID=A0A8R7TI76_TRIUA|nr:DNA cross-link repair protein SNM1 [Triticum urartu]XP_048557239.1 DNA cross-link repair protein SNM1 [Triticum urartu]